MKIYQSVSKYKENYVCTIEQEITVNGLGLMRIEAYNAVIHVSKNRDDSSTELSGTCQKVGLMRIAYPAPCVVVCD